MLRKRRNFSRLTFSAIVALARRRDVPADDDDDMRKKNANATRADCSTTWRGGRDAGTISASERGIECQS